MASELEPREELASIAASLRAYLEWQVDCGSGGIPRRPRGVVAVAAPAPVAVAAFAAPPVAAPAPPPPAAPVIVPVALRSLDVIQAEVASCSKCVLADTRKNTVFARGNPKARLAFVGEAPGADEDAAGIPFVGKAGQLLDRMIQAMGLDPENDVYICNIIKCRPPGNRRPEPAEVDECIPYLHDQLAHVEPQAIVALGNTAVAALLGTKLGITKIRGAWKLYKGRIPVMPTYHPSYLLREEPRQAEAKRQVWEDLQTVMKELGLERKR